MRRYTGRDGVQLAYRELRQGRPLILLPGFGTTSRSMIDLGPGRALAALGHRVIATDPRGNGYGARDPTKHQDLTQVEPPTLVVIGADDERRPGGPDLAQALPHGRFTEIPGDHGHAIATPELVDVTHAFLTQVHP